MMNAIEFLKHEHQTAKAAFAKVLDAAPEKRGELWKRLTPELKAHEQIENAGLYQPLSRDAATKDSRLAGWRQQHQAEVEKVEGLMTEIERLRPEEQQWLTKVKEVHSSLETHIKEEEGEIFPRIGQVWDVERLDRSGREMSEMKSKKARAA
jgi:hemerythrin-like domain-containing protein